MSSFWEYVGGLLSIALYAAMGIFVLILLVGIFQNFWAFLIIAGMWGLIIWLWADPDE